MATFLCGAQMLEHLNLTAESKRLHEAIRQVLSDPTNHTADLGGKATTSQVTQAVLNSL
jgi:tartrate dehydrogenase/decarboxylase/D-malate dehydrogenase